MRTTAHSLILAFALVGCTGTTPADDTSDPGDDTSVAGDDTSGGGDDTSGGGDDTSGGGDDTSAEDDTSEPVTCIDYDTFYDPLPFTFNDGTVDKTDEDSGSCGPAAVGGAGTGGIPGDGNELVVQFTAQKAGRYAFQVTDRTRFDVVLYARDACGGNELPAKACANCDEKALGACVNEAGFAVQKDGEREDPSEVMLLDLDEFQTINVVVDGGRSYVEMLISEADITEQSCADRVDSDFDGLTDCFDSDCLGNEACAEDCSNGKDDNGLGVFDCEDPNCFTDVACVEICDNDIDDNEDGVFDCNDVIQCGEAPNCQNTCPDVAIASSLPQTFTGNTLGNNDDVRMTCGGTNVGDEQIEYTATVTGTHIIDMVGSDYDAAFSVREGCAPTDNQLVCYDNTLGNVPSGTVEMKKGATYIINVGGAANSEGSYVLNIAPLEANEATCDDGRDLDNDGRIDCTDVDCASFEACAETECANEIDDNNNGLEDCEDPACVNDPACLVLNAAP